jgi:hypothetical protein
MTKSSAKAGVKQISFGFDLEKPVIADFSAGDVVSDGGMLLLRAADDRLGLTKRISKCIEENRDPDRVKHKMQSLVAQEIFPRACGYEDTNDATVTRHSSAFKIGSGQLPSSDPLASFSTQNRLENGVSVDDVLRIQDELPKLFLKRSKRPPKHVSLYMDTTHDPVYGTQQLSFYNGFYKEYCYTDLFLFCEGFPLGAVVRAGNAAPAEGSIAMLNRVTDALRAKRRTMRIEFAADSAFGSPAMYDYCEKNRITYYIGIGPNHALECLAKPFVTTAYEKYIALYGKPKPLHGREWRQKEERIRYSTKEEGRMQELFEKEQRVRVYGEFVYQARTWETAKRVIVRVDYTAEGPDVRFVVTNHIGGKPGWVYEKKYCARASCENNIKELKALKCDRLSCQEYLPNQFRLLMHVCAYILMLETRRHLPRSTRNISIQTLLLRFIKIGALIRETSRAVHFCLSSNHPWQHDFFECASRLGTS